MRFRKIPLAVEAIQWTGDNVDTVSRWLVEHAKPAADDSDPARRTVHFDYTVNPPVLSIPTPEGVMVVSAGDWIIRGAVKNELYPCKPDIFAATYDEEFCQLCAQPPAPFVVCAVCFSAARKERGITVGENR